jgi:tetratricopeptide (TPR) repeat protein
MSSKDASLDRNKGLSLNELSRFEEALVYFDQAIRINPNNTELYINKANALEDLNRKEDALVSYNEAIRTDPNYGLF